MIQLHGRGGDRARCCAFVVAFALAIPTLAVAQTTGSIAGQVYDQSGQPLRGIKIVASSDTQIGGARTTTSGADGSFRVLGLTPGRFKVIASAPRLRTVELTNIRIVQGTSTQVDIVMEIEAAGEEVRVVQKAPLVNTSSVSVGESFDEEFLNELPLSSRSYQGVMALTPGVSDIGGSGNPQVRGGTFFNNSYTVDGFQTTDPVTHTFGTNFSYSAISSVQVETAGGGAEHSDTLGAVANVVTKSGSNRFQVDAQGTYSDQNMQFFRDERDRGTNRAAALSLLFSGPILKDRVWFVLSSEVANATFTLPTDPVFGAHPSFSVLALDSVGKLTWAVTTRNKLELKGGLSVADFQNQVQSRLVEAEAEERQQQETLFGGLQWTSTLTDTISLIARVGTQLQHFDVGPQSCLWDPTHCDDLPSTTDRLTGVVRQNANSHTLDNRKRLELSGTLEWFPTSRRLGEHGIKAGAKYEELENAYRVGVPGDAIYFTRGNQPSLRQDICSNDPKVAKGECHRNYLYSLVRGSKLLLFAEDKFRPTRYLTITPGIAFHEGRSNDDGERVVVDTIALTPHLAVNWNVTHDGRTSLHGAINSKIDTGFLAIARFLSRRLFRKTCEWDPEVGDYVRNCFTTGGDSGTTVGLPCGPDGRNPDGSRCDTKLRGARMWELVLGAEREILPGVSLSADLIYRKFVHQFEDVETNAFWNKGGTEMRREAGYKTGRAEIIYDLGTPDEATRRYKGVQLVLRKKEGLLKAMAAYSLSYYDGVDDSSFASAFLDNPGQTPYYYGPLSADARHDLRVLGSYYVKPWLALGVNYQFLSGGPYNRFGFNTLTVGFDRFQTKRGYNWQGTLNPDDDAPLRLPDLTMLGIQLHAGLEPLIKRKVEILLDVLNVLGLRTTTSVIESDGAFWGLQASRLPPTRARLTMRYRF